MKDNVISLKVISMDLGKVQTFWTSNKCLHHSPHFGYVSATKPFFLSEDAFEFAVECVFIDSKQ